MKQANPINITHIDHVVIRVNDLENMIAFYRDVLGCKLEARSPRSSRWYRKYGLNIFGIENTH